jgi:sugar lactone lactonase YvrE
VRRMLALCAVAVTIFAAFALAQNNSTANTIVVTGQDYPSTYTVEHDQPDVMPKTTLTIASKLSPRAMGIHASDDILITRGDSSNRVGRIGAVDIEVGGGIPPSNYLYGIGSRYAGTGVAGFLGDGGPALSAELDLETKTLVERSGLAVARGGTVFIADTRNATIRAGSGFSSSEPSIIRSVAGKWAARQNVTLVEPMGIALDGAGNLYIADHGADAIDMMDAQTGQLSILAHVVSPASIAVTEDGTKVFVASPESGGVFAIATGTRAIAMVPGFAPTARETSDASASGPCANVFAAPAGAIASSTAAAAEPAATVASAAAKVCPAGLAADGRGNLFVADANNGKILRVDAISGKLTTPVAGMITPGDIEFDRDGDLFVAEQGRSRIIAMGQLGAPLSNLTLTAPALFPAPCPQVSNPFTFCNTPQGGTSKQAIFTLTNTSATVTETGITITPAFVPVGTNPPPPPTNFTTISTSCTSTLAPNATCSITMAFTPLTTGAITGSLGVTDVQGDSTTANLAGTSDTFTLQLAAGQPTEVSIFQGGTATWMAEIVPDNVYGSNGEQVSFGCPANMPLFTTCSFTPCPVAITPGTNASFNIVIATSSVTKSTPPVPNPCDSAAAGAAPGLRRPTMFIYVRQPVQQRGAILFPALALLAILCVLTLVFGWYYARRRSPRRLVATLLAFAAFAAIVFVGCGGSKGVIPTKATPVGITNLTFLGDAVDSQGNPLNASRPISIVLNVLKGT